MSKLYHYIKSHGVYSVGVCILVGLCIYGVYFIFFRPYVTTDNAYVGANYISVAAQVSGVATVVNVSNNQYVRKNDLLFEIDPLPFIIAVQKAQAQLDLMGNTVREAAANVDQAEAIVAQREAALVDVQINSARIFNLVGRNVLPAIDKDNATANLKTAEQALIAAQAQLDSARIHLGKLGAENEQIRFTTAELDKAKLDLTYTRIFAPYDGQISNCTINPGQYVKAGASQFALIDYTEFWVDANLKETQMQDVRVGQKVYISVDMYPDKEFKGEVNGLSGATGTVFSLLPPQNATGNWVKVTQRVPVRVMVKPLDSNYPLKIGTSASVKIKVK